MESGKKRFASGLNFYKLAWVYIIGAFAGFLVETVWCFFRYHRYEWRSGMAFTPFNPVYGLGAAALYLCLYKINKKNVPLIFLIGALAGTAVELFCSYFQEMLFDSFSWDYRHLPFNFEGRICLGMSFGWGALSVVWVWLICPALEKAISFIPEKAGKPLTVFIVTLIALDAIVTVSAMTRWLARLDGEMPLTFAGRWLDALFPDSRMDFMFPRIHFIK